MLGQVDDVFSPRRREKKIKEHRKKKQAENDPWRANLNQPRARLTAQRDYCGRISTIRCYDRRTELRGDMAVSTELPLLLIVHRNASTPLTPQAPHPLMLMSSHLLPVLLPPPARQFALGHGLRQAANVVL